MNDTAPRESGQTDDEQAEAEAEAEEGTCAPLALAFGITVTGWGFLIAWQVFFCGLALMAIAIAMWRAAGVRDLAHETMEAPNADHLEHDDDQAEAS